MKFNDITPAVQRHLSKVYATLSAGVAVAAVTAWLAISTGISLGWLAPIGMFASLFWLMLQGDKQNTTKRLGIFSLFAAFQGASVASLVAMSIDIDPSIVITALLGSVAVFASFSAFALVSQRRSMLFLGGILSSVLSLMLLGSLINMFFRSSAFFGAELYIGLAVFVGYVVFDTQLIVEKASSGNRDFVWHATELFIDFVGLFVRILIILMRNSQKKKEDNRRRN